MGGALQQWNGVDKMVEFPYFDCFLQNVMCRKESPLYWVEVAVSLNGRAVALVDKDGYLWGGSSDFKVGRGSSMQLVCLLLLCSNRLSLKISSPFKSEPIPPV